MSEAWTVNSDRTLFEFLKHIQELYQEHGYLTIEWSTGKQRSNPQNNALHLFCEQLARELNAAGYDMKRVIKPEVDIPWTKQSVKEFLWRPLQLAMFGVESTADANRDQYPEVYDTLNSHLGQKLGIQCPPWPTKERG